MSKQELKIIENAIKELQNVLADMEEVKTSQISNLTNYTTISDVVYELINI